MLFAQPLRCPQKEERMKKSMIITMLAVVLTGPIVGLDRAVAQEQTGAVLAAVQAKNPWSVTGLLETERVVTGKNNVGFSNIMYLQAGRSVLENMISDVSVALRLYGENRFAPAEEKSGLNRYFHVLDPALLLTKANLFEVAGISATAQTRYSMPLSSDSRLEKRNPHRGHWRQIVSLERSSGDWTLTSDHFVQYYGYRNDLNQMKDRAPNTYWREYHDIGARYQVVKDVVLNTRAEFDRSWKRVDAQTSTGLDWVNSVEWSGAKNLTVESGIVLSAPNQTPRKYFEDRRNNTRARLDIAYKFL